MTSVIFSVGLCGYGLTDPKAVQAAYDDLMFANKAGWSIKAKVQGKLPPSTPMLITQWNHDITGQITSQFPTGDLVLVGHSLGGCKVSRVSFELAAKGRAIKKLILIDPVDIDRGGVPNTTGFAVAPNVVACECYYRTATAAPWSAWVNGVRVGAKESVTINTSIKNVNFSPKSSNPWDAHGEPVWGDALIQSIKASL